MHPEDLQNSYVFLVNFLGALVHAVEALAHDRQYILLCLYRLQHVVLNALDALLVQVLEVLEHRWQKVIIILVLKRKMMMMISFFRTWTMSTLTGDSLKS